MKLFSVFLIFMAIGFGQPCLAKGVFPENNGKALVGVKAFNAIVTISTWNEETGDRSRMLKNVQAAFELSLRRDGIIVDTNAQNYLFCRLSFAEAFSLVAYSYTVEYYTIASAGVHRLQWMRHGIVTVGRNNLLEEDVAKDCTKLVANEWLKQNPK